MSRNGGLCGCLDGVDALGNVHDGIIWRQQEGVCLASRAASAFSEMTQGRVTGYEGECERDMQGEDERMQQ